MTRRSRVAIAVLLPGLLIGLGPRTETGEGGDPQVPFCEPESTASCHSAPTTCHSWGRLSR